MDRLAQLTLFQKIYAKVAHMYSVDVGGVLRALSDASKHLTIRRSDYGLRPDATRFLGASLTMRSISFARLDLDLLDEGRLLHRAIELDTPSWRVAERRLFRADQWDRELCNQAVHLALHLGSDVKPTQEVVAFWVDRFKKAGACTQSEYGLDTQKCRKVSHAIRSVADQLIDDLSRGFDGCVGSLKTKLLECTKKLERGKWPRLAKNKGHDIFESGELRDLVRLLPYYPRLSLINRDALCRISHATLDDFFKSFAEMLSTELIQDEDAAQYETKTVNILDLGLDADADAEYSNKCYYIAARLWRDLNVKLVGVPEQMYEGWYFDPVSRTYDRNTFSLACLGGAMKVNALSVLAREWMMSRCQHITILGPVDVQAIDTFADAISSGSLPNLGWLFLDRTNIGDDGMQAFASAVASGSMANLRILYLADNKIGDAGMGAFAGAIASGSLRNLKTLTLMRNRIGDAGMIEFSRAIASGSLPNLGELYLSNNNIGHVGMQALASAVASGSLGALQELFLRYNQIGDAGMSALAGAIASGSLGALQTLDLRVNQIGDAGMIELSRAIASGSLGNLIRLDLDNNNIGDAGMTEFSRAIASGSLPNLNKLYLEGNKIGDAGMTELSHAIASGSMANLRILYLADNKIGDAGMGAFAGAIASGSLGNLLSLDLQQNGIGDEGMKAFAASLCSTNESLPMLKTLRITENRFGEDGMSVLVDAIQRGCLPKLSRMLLYVLCPDKSTSAS